MAITGTPTTPNDDVVTVTPTGWYEVNAGDGIDTLVVDYASLSTDVNYVNTGYGWYAFTDDFFSAIEFYNFERFALYTGSGADYLVGGNLNDYFSTGGGNDTIVSGLGADTIIGGAGTDRWVGNYSTLSADIGVTLHNTLATTVSGIGARVRQIEEAVLTTGAGNDFLDARLVTGNQDFSSGAGNDTLMVASGHSTYNAGLGEDLVVADFGAATTRIGLTNMGYGWYKLGDQAGAMSVNMYAVERFDFTGGLGDDTLPGGALADRLVGGAGNDWLIGAQGTDTIIGGDGTDTWEANYSANTAAVRVDLNLQSSNVSLIEGIEAMRLTGGSANDRLTAHAGIYNDTINGGDGNDVITTGRGDDEVNGGGGIDTLIVDWSALSEATDGIVYSNQGYGWYRYASPQGDIVDFYAIERFDLTGGAGNDNLVGWGDLDTLRGGGGDDTLDSGAGRAVIDGGAGTDLWAANISAIGTPQVFDALASQTVAQMTDRGFSISNVERLNLVLGGGNDNISTAGYALNDTIRGGEGNDTINPGMGKDEVNGELGTDLLVVSFAGVTQDIVNTNQGYGWWRYGAHDNTNYVDYYSIEQFSLTGGLGNDALNGGALTDTLNGGAGNDTLNGGTGGRDIIRGGTGTDTWILDLGASERALSLTLAADGSGLLVGNGTRLTSIENVQLTTGLANDSINLSASLGNHVLSTGAGDDFISLGRGMHNEVNGGAGTDHLVFDASLATAGLRTTNEGYGWWQVGSTDLSYRTKFYAIETFDITGSAYNDRISGFGGADVLRGGGGHDILNGGAGNDTLFGGDGVDCFQFSSLTTNGTDLVADAEAGDFLRFFGVRINGFSAGDGTGLLQNLAHIQSSGGMTSIFIGVNSTAGADFRVDLVGTFGVGDFQVVSYSDFTGAADLILI